MDREQNTPDTSCENTASSPELERQDPQLPEEPQLEAATPLEDCDASYTAVLDGKQEQTASEEEKQDPSQTATDPGAPVTPQKQPPKKKSRTSTGTKLLIAFVAAMLALVILLTGLSSALAILLIARLPESPEAPDPSTDESFSIIYSEDPSDDSSPLESLPPVETETPPPSNYESDAWYNPDDLDDDALSVYEKVCALCNPSIVAISTDVGSGSGVVWTSNGYIVTNNHVVEGASSLSVMLSNGKKYPASLIDTNVENDLALVRVNVTGLLPAQLGDSDQLRMGQPVVAIGNALGILSNTATEGILSAITREINVEGQTMSLMQISAPINPGNSGGGCFDINGKLIGVVNAKTSATGIEGLGFAIPVNTAKTIIGNMISSDKTTLQKGVGITACYEITEENYADFSTQSLLKQIEKINGGPLYGIYTVSDGMVDYVNSRETFENGDVLKSINGTDVKTLKEVAEIVNKCAVGEELTITVLRLTQSGGFMKPTYTLEEHTFKIRVIEMYK